MLLEIRETGPMPVNTYILKDEQTKKAVIIDLGGGFRKIKNDLDVQGFEIKCILNTHGHFDHVLGEAYVKENYPEIPVYMHKDDLPHIININEEMHAFGFNIEAKKITINDFIDETAELYLGGSRINILKTPGHSKGSLSFYTEGKLFCGDTLFFRSIGRTDFYDGNYNTLIDTIKNKFFTLPDDTIVYPGHGPSTLIGDEKKLNDFQR